MNSKELRKRAIEAMDSLPKGGKARLVKLGHSRQIQTYIRDTETYSDTLRLNQILLACKQVSKDMFETVERSKKIIEGLCKK